LNELTSVSLGSHGGGSGSLMPAYGGGDGDGDPWEGAETPGGNLNEQIVVVLARLQEDMQSVLQRLQTLEALTASQVRPDLVSLMNIQQWAQKHHILLFHLL